eukprot:scaffold1226_cov58-Isochrysis_galbana.AAC.1
MKRRGEPRLDRHGRLDHGAHLRESTGGVEDGLARGRRDEATQRTRQGEGGPLAVGSPTKKGHVGRVPRLSPWGDQQWLDAIRHHIVPVIDVEVSIGAAQGEGRAEGIAAQGEEAADGRTDALEGLGAEVESRRGGRRGGGGGGGGGGGRFVISRVL